MNQKTRRNLTIALVLTTASAALLITLQAVRAQSLSRRPVDPAYSLAAIEDSQSSDASLANAMDSVPGVRFVHVATTANIGGHRTYIDHYLLNNNPNAILFVTQNWNPGGAGEIYNNHPIGVWYSGTEGKWAVFNENVAAVPVGASFNILIPDPGTNLFVHQATVTNTFYNYTVFDHPLTNNNPDALVIVTQNYNPGGVGGTYNDHAIGVWYTAMEQKWAVFNQDNTSTMPISSSFNILIPTDEESVFVHEATAGNTVGNHTYIDHPLANDSPYALVYITQNWNPGGGTGTYNDHPTGVFYSQGTGRWAIFNQNLADSMPEGASFSVVIPTADTEFFVHSATAGNITDNWTDIDHPATNSNPNAIAFVTQNWNPGGVGEIYNDQEIGVWYDNGAAKWAVFNQNQTSTMPISAAFNVLIPNVDAGVFIHETTITNTNGHHTSIDHPLTNGDFYARLFVTQNWNPGGGPGTYNDNPIGVTYFSGQWHITNQNLVTMPVGAAFNILVPISDTRVFVHRATADSLAGKSTYIDHPLINNNPSALIYVTQNRTPPFVSWPVDNAHSVGVWYNSVSGRWAIFNQDGASILLDAAFNVLVAPGRLYLPTVMR